MEKRGNWESGNQKRPLYDFRAEQPNGETGSGNSSIDSAEAGRRYRPVRWYSEKIPTGFESSGIPVYIVDCN